MLSLVWNTLLVNPLLNTLVAVYQLTANLGLSIIVLTFLIRTVLIPFMLPQLKTFKKQRDLQPEIDKIKEKYKHDKKKQAEMQMELFKKHGLNPASGCLTQIVTILILIALYGVIRQFSMAANVTELNNLIYFDFLRLNINNPINTDFLYLDLAKPDPFYVLAILSGLLQLVASKMTFPYVEAGEKAAKKTPDKKDDLAYNMQEQMLYTMPIMNFIIGLTLPSGMMLYIVTSTLFSIGQTYFVSGWGGLAPWLHKIKLLKHK